MRVVDGEEEVAMKDPQGKSPYLLNILRRGVYEQEWVDVPDLRRQVRTVLRGDLGLAQRKNPATPAA